MSETVENLVKSNFVLFQQFFNIFSAHDDQINFSSFALCQASQDASLEYPQWVLWRRGLGYLRGNFRYGSHGQNNLIFFLTSIQPQKKAGLDVICWAFSCFLTRLMTESHVKYLSQQLCIESKKCSNLYFVEITLLRFREYVNRFKVLSKPRLNHN